LGVILNKTAKVFSLILFKIVVLTSCQPKNKTNDQFLKSIENTRIVNGEITKADTAPFNSVVGIFDAEFQFACTGTLIASSTVLTAGHCIESSSKSLYIVFSNHLIETIKLGFDVSQNAQIRKVTNAMVHPDYNANSDGGSEFGMNDLAVLHFEGLPPAPYKPIQLDQSVPAEKELVILSGFGVSDVQVNGVDGARVPNIAELIDQGSVICFDKKNTQCVEIIMTGDGPLRSTIAPVSSIEGSEFLNDETESGTCSGDSGGPAFRGRGQDYVLTGVTSRGSLRCNKDGVYTLVSKYLKWISARLK